MEYKYGNCDDIKNAVIYMLRSIGIPATGHFYTCSPDDNIGGHSWTAIRDTTGKDVPLRYPGLEVSRDIDVGYKKGKVYQACYGFQRDKPHNIRYVPDFFRSPFIKDVTSHYSEKNEFVISLPATNMPYLYLGIQTSWKTTLIAISEIKQNKAVFRNVEPGLIYQLLYYEDDRQIPADHPVKLNEDGTIHSFRPDTLNLQTHSVYRKLFLPAWLYSHMNYMIGGVVEGARDKKFSDIVFSRQIQDSVRYIVTKEIYPDTADSVRYVRFTSPKNRTINLAEITFYSEKNNTPIKEIQISGDKPADVFKNGYLHNISDENPLTYYLSADSGASIVFDLLKPTTLSRIEILPRTDDNFIRPGDFYELFYHGGERGWISLGTQTAEQRFLTYENIPSNALLWLKNHTRGMEEQVFYFKEGKQLFNGKEKIIY